MPESILWTNQEILDNKSPILANLVMNYLFDKAKKRLDFQLPFIYIYVDDALLSIPRLSVDEINFNVYRHEPLTLFLLFTIKIFKAYVLKRDLFFLILRLVCLT